jgi:hypothetical protein
MDLPAVTAPLAEGGGAQGLDGVKLAGLVIGLLLLVAAIRAMFGKRKP